MVDVTVPTIAETVMVLVEVAVSVVVCAKAPRGSRKIAASDERCIATELSKDL